ncbi:MAG: prepilin-type N-terminal cleavage/methylation domain-containing protein [Lysobacter sp.]|nr:prepilin-type N-terminal cleavage/methylation domain-containing protein [Lysobacter sp.]
MARPAARGRAEGFTLIELMIGVVVAAILLAVAVPSFESTINGSRLAAASNELLASLQTARMEAIRFNHRTAVCLSRNAQAAAPTCAPANATDATGWITFVDANSNGTYQAASDTLLRQSTVPPNVRVLPSANVPNRVRVTYNADGFARNLAGSAMLSARIDVCLPTKRPLENVRRIEFGHGSRLEIERANTNGACATPANPP